MKIVISSLVASVLATGSAHAAILNFISDPSGFSAATSTLSLSVVDFEALIGQNLVGQNVDGVTFSSPDGNSLDVVRADATNTVASTYTSGVIDPATNVLPATSGVAVLAPGGEAMIGGNDLSQRDSLELRFDAPVSSFAIDILLQSLDFNPLSALSAFDVNGNLVLNAPIDDGNSQPGGSPAGTIFVGIVSDDPLTNIARILISEDDSDAAFPDNNLGYDTVRFTALPRTPTIPVPASLPLALAGFAALAALGRRRSNRQPSSGSQG